MAHEVLRTLWAESTFFLSRGEVKALEEATSHLEMNNMWKVAWSRNLGVASPGQGEQRTLLRSCSPERTGKLLLQRLRGSFLYTELTSQSWGWGATGALVDARSEGHLGDLGCKLFCWLSSGGRLSILPSKVGSVKTHAWQSAQKPCVLPWTSCVFQDWHFPKCRAASGPLELCF